MARIRARYAASECAVSVKSSSENMTVIPGIVKYVTLIEF